MLFFNFFYFLFFPFFLADLFKVRYLHLVPKGVAFNREFLLVFGIKIKISLCPVTVNIISHYFVPDSILRFTCVDLFLTD